MDKHIRSSDGLSINLAQTDSLDLPFLDQLGQDGHRLLNRGVRVLSGALEDIDALLPVQDSQTLVHAAADVGFRSIWREFATLQTSLDAQDHLICLLRVLGEVAVEQVRGVALRRAVQLAAVPEVGAQLERGVQALEAGLLGRWGRVPCHSCIPVGIRQLSFLTVMWAASCTVDRGDVRMRPKPVGPTSFPTRVGILDYESPLVFNLR